MVQSLQKSSGQFLIKLNTYLITQQSKFTTRDLPKWITIYSRSKTYTWMFIMAFSTNNNNQKQHKCPLTGEWIKKLWYIHRTGCYSAKNGNRLLIDGRIWVNLKHIMLSERSYTQSIWYHSYDM